MKKLIILFCLLAPFFVSAQNNLNEANDLERIALNVVVPDQIANIPEQARSLLESKLAQVITEYGMAGEGVSPRFLVTAKMEVVTKDVTPTVPPMEAYTFEVYLYLVDFVDRNILSTTSFSTKGAGTNANRAYTNALRPVNLNNPQVKRFLDEGKRKIIEYYNTRCDMVIARANSQAAQKDFASALATLTGVPEVSRDCYLRSLDAVGPIYKQFIDHDCQVMITVASAVWAAEPNSSGALQAGAVLSQIDPDSRCYKDAQKQISQMAAKVQKDEQRDWNFMVKVFENQVELEKLRIKAFRDVGVAWGRNQQPTYNHVMWVFR